MSIQYRINKWDEYFENNRSKKVRDLAWVPVPNRHDGENYSMIMAHENGAEIFAAWVLIIQVASKCEPRGTLVRDGGKPHTPKTLSVKTRAPESWFNVALEYLAQETDWLIAEGLAEDCHPPATQVPPACHPTATQVPPDCHPPASQVTKKERKKEGKEVEAALPFSDSTEGNAKKPVSEHKKLVEAWCNAYEETHGSKYVFSGRDAKAAKTLLGNGVTPDELASLAKAAWANKGKDSWSCQNRTAALYDFADAFNKIQKELGKLGVSAQSGPKRDARGRIPFVDYMPDAPIPEGPRPDPKELFAKLRAEAEAAAKAREEAENPFNESSHDL